MKFIDWITKTEKERQGTKQKTTLYHTHTHTTITFHVADADRHEIARNYFPIATEPFTSNENDKIALKRHWYAYK